MSDRKSSNERSTSMVVPAAVLAVAALIAYGWPESSDPARDSSGRGSKAFSDGVADAGRGRSATSPAEIPAKGWKDVLVGTYEQIGEDRLLAVAAGVVFYGLLALFPAITALVSSYALFADPKTISDHLSFISDRLPAGTFTIVQDQVQRVLAKGDTKLGFAFAVSLLLALSSASRCAVGRGISSQVSSRPAS